MLKLLTKHDPILDDLPVTLHPNTVANNKDNHTKYVRQKHTPSYLHDYVCSSSSSHKEPSPSGSLYPIASFHSFDHLSPSQRTFSMSITKCIEPRTYYEACQHQCLVKGMKIELDALDTNNTWQLVEKPSHVKSIGSKWVYKVKHKVDGSIERYKDKLVAKGYNEI